MALQAAFVEPRDLVCPCGHAGPAVIFRKGMTEDRRVAIMRIDARGYAATGSVVDDLNVPFSRLGLHRLARAVGDACSG
ncbi:MAG: hypothetical protein EA346_14545 [Thioalkalivibrio sp.]|nr:MAG: hypothetical protein EA346_14545 [Thioalkalivibrio sp.]